MPIRRPRTPKPSLRHLVFLETMARSSATSPQHPSAHATLLTLRLLDHWMTLGAALASPDATAHRATRLAVNALVFDPELRGTLGAVLDAIASLHEPDAQPLLPRVHALGLLLEGRGLHAQAGDVHQTTSRFVDASTQLGLAYESLMHLGVCLRHTGELEWAEQAFGNAAVLATRVRDGERVSRAREARAEVQLIQGTAQSEIDSSLRDHADSDLAGSAK